MQNIGEMAVMGKQSILQSICLRAFCHKSYLD